MSNIVPLAPDVEGALKTWLPSRPSVQAVATKHTIAQIKAFLGIPSNNPPDTLIDIAQIGGSWQPGSQAPIYQALVQIDCWAAYKTVAYDLKAAVEGELFALDSQVPFTATLTALGADVQSTLWFPDDADTPRYVITTSVSVITIS